MSAKGDARRDALVRGAMALLREQGFDAVSHRAVAARADVPLAATTYYFGSLTELLQAAVDRVATDELSAATDVLDALSSRRRTPTQSARVVVRLVAGGVPDAARLLGLYERYLQAGRVAALRDPVRRWNTAVADLVAQALARCGRPIDGPTAALLLSCVDGVLVTALAEGAPDLEGTAAGRLAPAVRALAPASAQDEGVPG